MNIKQLFSLVIAFVVYAVAHAQIPTDLCDLGLGFSCSQDVAIKLLKNGTDFEIETKSDFTTIEINYKQQFDVESFCFSNVDYGFQDDAIFSKVTILFYKDVMWQIVLKDCVVGGGTLVNKLTKRFPRYYQPIGIIKEYNDGKTRIVFEGKDLSIISLIVSQKIR